MSFLLDTNTCVQYLNGRCPRVRDRLSRVLPSDVSVCSVVKAELFFGAMRSRDPSGTLRKQQAFLELFNSYPFDDRAAMAYGDIRSRLSAQGTPIGPNDLMIAAIALVNQRILVTHNTREFARVQGLAIEDWEV